MTALEPDELLTEIRMPVGAFSRSAVVEVARRRGDYALAGVAVLAHRDDDRATVALSAFGVGGTAQRLVQAESFLADRVWDGASLDEAASLASGEVSPFDDLHADGAYRRQLLRTLTHRALREVIQ